MHSSTFEAHRTLLKTWHLKLGYPCFSCYAQACCGHWQPMGPHIITLHVLVDHNGLTCQDFPYMLMLARHGYLTGDVVLTCHDDESMAQQTDISGIQGSP
jgi:hypothetical protein